MMSCESAEIPCSLPLNEGAFSGPESSRVLRTKLPWSSDRDAARESRQDAGLLKPEAGADKPVIGGVIGADVGPAGDLGD